MEFEQESETQQIKNYPNQKQRERVVASIWLKKQGGNRPLPLLNGKQQFLPIGNGHNGCYRNLYFFPFK